MCVDPPGGVTVNPTSYMANTRSVQASDPLAWDLSKSVHIVLQVLWFAVMTGTSSTLVAGGAGGGVMSKTDECFGLFFSPCRRCSILTLGWRSREEECTLQDFLPSAALWFFLVRVKTVDENAGVYVVLIASFSVDSGPELVSE